MRALPLGRCLVAALTVACASSAPPTDLTPPDLFDWAQARFDDGSYATSQRAFQEFILRDPLSPLTDSAQFMMAESLLRAGQKLEAAEEFRRIATSRPNSPWADDAQFGACRAYWASAPKVELSQEFTRRALDECGRLLQFFPQTELRDEAEAVIADARARLAEKSFEIGKYYFKQKLYTSANVYFEDALAKSPAPEILPELLARMYESYTEVGYAAEARIVLDRLLREFPSSEEADGLRAEADRGQATDGADGPRDR